MPDWSQEACCSQPRLSRCASAEGKLLPTQGQVAAMGATAGGGCSPLLSPLDGSQELEGWEEHVCVQNTTRCLEDKTSSGLVKLHLVSVGWGKLMR